MPESLYPALKALAEPNRLHILCDLGLECRPVTDIIAASGLSQTLVSFHLRVLREAGLVRAERRGSFIYYCLADPELLRILRDLKVWLNTRNIESDSNQHSPLALMSGPEMAAIHVQETI
ncbi:MULTISPECIES: ArsR/SmtB family transcription factor [Acidithiobacillaceae]|nr:MULTISPECIES: metalloregulator ArsR/SmtB family transcription factor [Acidithiobacillaceae]